MNGVIRTVTLGEVVMAKASGQSASFEYKVASEHKGKYIPEQSIAELISNALPLMSKAQIEQITAIVRHHYMQRFKKHKRAKYGNLNKGFTEQELQAFMRVIENRKHKLLFEYMSTIGLRVGEAVRVNLKDLNLETRELTVHTEKARTLDTLILPAPLFKATIEFAQENSKEITGSGGYLFFRDRMHSKRPEGFMEVNYARGRFSYYLEKAHLDEVYDLSEEADGRPIRKLHRLTSHSLRHFAITRFAKSTNGNLILSSKFARHSNPNTTMTYIHNDKKEIYDVIDSISVGEVALLKKQLK
jgi:integrase